MKIVIVGLGYVGLTTMAILHRRLDGRSEIFGYDTDSTRVEDLKNGKMPFEEPGMKDILYSDGRLRPGLTFMSTGLIQHLRVADVVFFTFSTPVAKGRIVSTSMEDFVEINARFFKSDATVVIRSTVPVGTTRKIHNVLRRSRKSPIHAIFIPEFLVEGKAIDTAMSPDRCVLGCSRINQSKIPYFLEIAKLFSAEDQDPMTMSMESAELAKLASNSMLAAKLAFVNDLARYSDVVNANILDVVKAVGADKRIGSEFMTPGLGIAGSCLPKDYSEIFTASIGYTRHAVLSLLGTRCSDDTHYQFILETIREYAGPAIRIGVLGTTFKEGTDDVRGSKAIEIVKSLTREFHVSTYDPKGNSRTEDAMAGYKNYIIHESIEEVLSSSPILVILTAWDDFKNLSVETLLRHGITTVMDFKYVLTNKRLDMHLAGITYICPGVPTKKSKPKVI